MAANATSFKRGFDSRRCIPQNAGIWEFRQKLSTMLRGQSLEAFNYLVEVLNDKKLNPKLRKECAVEILNRSWGVPVSTIHVEHSETNRNSDNPKDYSDAELESIIARLSEEEGKPVIEGEIVVSDAGVYSSVDADKSLKVSGVSE